MTSESLAQTPASTTQRIAWAILIVATLAVCYFANLSVIGFVGPDEPRYAWIARDMAESGDWVTPRLYGKPWFEKPPLLYWGGAIFFRLIPTHPEIAARLPSAISALLATLALAWLAWRTYGQECARWLLLLLPTSVGMIGFSHAAATDMPFAAMLTLAMVCATVALGLGPANDDTPVLPRTPWLALLLFGFFLGLAVLAKGPAAIILSGGAVFFWAIFTKRWRDAFRLLHPAAVITFCATALPWYILCARRNPDFFRIFIIEHNFKRFLTPEFQHIQPFWYYVPILLIALSPWVVGAVAAGILAPNRAGWTSPLRLLALCWLLWPVLFFSLSKSKLPGYILPAIPAAVLVLVSILAQKAATPPGSSRIFALATGCTLGLSALSFVAFEKKIPNGTDLVPDAWHSFIYIPLFLGGALCFFYGRKNQIAHARIFAVAAILLALLGTYAGLYFLDKIYSARYASKEAIRLYQDFDPSSAAVYQEQRGTVIGLDFYFRTELPVWTKNSPAKWVFTSRKGVRDIEAAGFKCTGYIVSPVAIPCQRDDSLRGGSGGRQPQ
jgi:4-amino-4-deoxy-L-arabinose transferase-like glycosyltransferase